MNKSIYGTISPVYTKDKNGNLKLCGYRGRKGTGRNPITGKYHQEPFYGKSIEDVKKQMRAFLNKPVDCLNCMSGLSVEEWTVYWLENIKLPMLKKSSKKTYRQMIEIINKAIGWRKINKTSRIMLQQVINSRASENKNTSMLYSVICQCFRDAYECRYIDSDITKGLIYKDKPAAVKVPLSKAEDMAMVDFIKGNALENAVLFLRGSACRVSETCGLCWDQVHFEEGYILVSKQLGDDKETDDVSLTLLNTTKNNLFAPVYVPQYVMDALDRERIRQEENARKNMRKYKNDFNYVFTDELGKPYTQKQINKYIKKIGAAIGRPELTAHYFRHTRASEVYAKTHDPLIVQQLLRHISLDVTFRYLHLIEGAGVRVEEALQTDYDRLFSVQWSDSKM